MLNQYEQSIYLRGARDILLRLKNDFELQMTPIVDASYISKHDDNSRNIFAIPMRIPKQQKMFGKAVLDLLIQNKVALEKVLLQEKFIVRQEVTKQNKKGDVEEYKLILANK